MFTLSLVFLALLATIMVLWIDVRHIVETGDESADLEALLGPVLSKQEAQFEATAYSLGRMCGILLLLLWPVFIAEQLVYRFLTSPDEPLSRRHPYWWVHCFVPPLRLCSRQRDAQEERIWFPKWGWQVADRHLQRRLERIFSIPMIWIALLILPVLALQFFFHQRIIEYPTLRIFLHIGTGLIWFAFATEFIVMVSVADKKLNYCKTHWLDLVIILLPLISFLRTLRLMRATRLLKVGKLQQLSRVVRIYRLRGVAMRGFRALLLLEVLHRLLRTKPERRIAKLEEQYLEKQLELKFLRLEIDELKAKHGVTSPSDDPPVDGCSAAGSIETSRAES